MAEKIKNKVAKEKEDAQAKVREFEAAEKKRMADIEMAKMIVKHNLSATCWDEILDALLARDKYMRLAHFLRLNRGDWSEGCNYAQCGLDGFSIDDDVDKAISANIAGHISDWDGDGRIFRDCEWSYDRIFGLVADKQLLADYEIANSNVPRW